MRGLDVSLEEIQFHLQQEKTMTGKSTRTRKPSATRDSRQKFKSHLKDCARCGSHHRVLQFKAFRQPITLGDVQWQFWAMCPKTGDPIILQKTHFAKT